MSQFLSVLVDYAWGMPLICLLLGGGFYLAWLSKLKTLKGFFYSFRLLLGKIHHEADDQSKGQISHFAALTNALSATVGMGNIAGVALAINQGGAGAIFWMWVAAIVGMNTKFFECTLAVMFRGEDHRGEAQGGPMYVINKALPKAFKPLAYAFAIFGLIGTLSLYNANQLSTYLFSNYSINTYMTGIVMAFIVGLICFGGVKRIGETTSKIVPIMCVLYVIGCLGVIFLNLEKVPDLFLRIFQEAFGQRAVIGGALGISVKEVMKIGMKRAAFSNEAGIGTAPMAHGNAHTSEPVAEGLVAMIGPFIDTIVVCTMTALVILIGTQGQSLVNLNGVLLTQKALEGTYGALGTHFLGLAVFLFSFSTLVGYANYNQKCFDFIFKGKSIFKHRRFYIGFYSLTIFFGSINSADDMINLLDIAFAFMAVPNMITTLILAPKVKEAMDIYFEKYLA